VLTRPGGGAGSRSEALITFTRDLLLRSPGILAALGVACMVAGRHVIRQGYHYVSPSAVAILAYALMPRGLRRPTLGTLVSPIH
jgi:hypothetical protein